MVLSAPQIAAFPSKAGASSIQSSEYPLLTLLDGDLDDNQEDELLAPYAMDSDVEMIEDPSLKRQRSSGDKSQCQRNGHLSSTSQSSRPDRSPRSNSTYAATLAQSFMSSGSSTQPSKASSNNPLKQTSIKNLDMTVASKLSVDENGREVTAGWAPLSNANGGLARSDREPNSSLNSSRPTPKHPKPAPSTDPPAPKTSTTPTDGTCEVPGERRTTALRSATEPDEHGQYEASTCHQCRVKTTRPKMICDQSKEPHCAIRICHSCLIVKPVYDHIPELRPPIFQFVPGGRMLCVKCRGICACVSCRRRRGEEEQCTRGRMSSRLEKETRPPAEKKTPSTAIRREAAPARHAGEHGKHDRLHHGAALPLPTQSEKKRKRPEIVEIPRPDPQPTGSNSHTTAPPRSLPSIKPLKAKQARPSNDFGASGSNSLLNSSNIHLLAELLTARNSSNPDIRKEPTESQLSSPPNESHIQGYLDFLGVRNKTRTLEVLEANGFHSHKIFKSPGLSRYDVMALGLTLGVVTVLFDNVVEYDDFLKEPTESQRSSPLYESHIQGYLDFLGVRDKARTLEVLEVNGFHSHKIFHSPSLSRSDVKALGLTLGVVTVLFDNVAKYDHFLSTRRA